MQQPDKTYSYNFLFPDGEQKLFRITLDAPGGKGKIPLTPQYILQHGDHLVFANYRGETCTYPESGDPC